MAYELTRSAEPCSSDSAALGRSSGIEPEPSIDEQLALYDSDDLIVIERERWKAFMEDVSLVQAGIVPRNHVMISKKRLEQLQKESAAFQHQVAASKEGSEEHGQSAGLRRGHVSVSKTRLAKLERDSAAYRQEVDLHTCADWTVVHKGLLEKLRKDSDDFHQHLETFERQVFDKVLSALKDAEASFQVAPAVGKGKAKGKV